VATGIIVFDFELFIGGRLPASLDPQKLNVLRFCGSFLLKADYTAVDQTDKYLSLSD
jgi:hypothetical protein